MEKRLELKALSLESDVTLLCRHFSDDENVTPRSEICGKGFLGNLEDFLRFLTPTNKATRLDSGGIMFSVLKIFIFEFFFSLKEF